MEFVFSAELTDLKTIYNVLKAITFKENAVVRPLAEGLKVTVEEMRCVETSAYIPSNLFTSYYIDTNQDIKFKLSLKVLTECFYIFGDDGNPSLKMTYKGEGSPLCLVIKHSEENIKVHCEIHTLNVEEFTDVSLAYECGSNKIVLSAGPFADVLNDLDNTSDVLELLLSPEPPYFRILTTSIMGESQIDIAKHTDMVLVFQWDDTFVYKYAFSHIKQILKVMNYANKVSISTSESGLLGLQFAISTDNKHDVFIEYYVTAMFNDDS